MTILKNYLKILNESFFNRTFKQEDLDKFKQSIYKNNDLFIKDKFDENIVDYNVKHTKNCMEYWKKFTEYQVLEILSDELLEKGRIICSKFKNEERKKCINYLNLIYKDSKNEWIKKYNSAEEFHLKFAKGC